MTDFSSDFLVNDNAVSGVQAAKVASLGDGRLVVVWATHVDKGNDLFAQLLSADGKPLGEAIRIDTSDVADLSTFSLTAMAGGLFAVANETLTDAKTVNVETRIFNSDGRQVGEAFQVDKAEFDQTLPTVEALPKGGILLSWVTHPGGDANIWQLQTQRFTAEGKPDGDISIINGDAKGEISNPVIAVEKDGSVFAAWTLSNDKATTIHAQVIDADGGIAGKEIVVTASDKAIASAPAIAMLSSGDIVVTWTAADPDGKLGTTIHARLFTARGEARGEEFVVTRANEFNSTSSSVTAIDGGGFVVAWTSDDSGDGWWQAMQTRARASLIRLQAERTLRSLRSMVQRVH